ncbi:NUDIX domain-containing protein [Hyphomicrobium sp.]|uniref:NUDIX domain-containing protein n=1 Tax=Hyphomicrobium sp. TaxID=82 RepID=UPI0039E5B8EF
MSSDANQNGSFRAREDRSLPARWISRVFQKYWRIVRGLRLSVEACIVDETGRVLMVRNESGGNWELPIGQVLKDESFDMALRRLLGTLGIEVNGRPEPAFFYARGKYEQTGLCLVRHWRRRAAASAPEPSFFPAHALPGDVCPSAAERIRRVTEDRTISQV